MAVMTQWVMDVNQQTFLHIENVERIVELLLVLQLINVFTRSHVSHGSLITIMYVQHSTEMTP